MDINRAAATTSDRIAAAFTRSGRSRKKLSEATGIPYATLDRRLRSGDGYTVREVIAIADALGIPVSDFFDGGESATRAAHRDSIPGRAA